MAMLLTLHWMVYATTIRGHETNLGNLIADSFLWQVNNLAASVGLEAIDIALDTAMASVMTV